MFRFCRTQLAFALVFLFFQAGYSQIQDKEQSKAMVELAAEMLKASQAEDDVRDIMVQAAELDTTNIYANFEAGRLHLRTIKKEQAAKYLLRIYRQQPTYRFDLEFHIASSFQLGLQFDKAIEFYNRYKLKYQRQPNYQGKDKVSLKTIERRLYECANGKEFLAQPKAFAIINMGPQVNSEAGDYAPVLNEKEDEIIFTSRRLDGNLNENVAADNKPYEDIFISTKTGGKWTKAANIGKTVNVIHHNSNLAITPDGKTLYTYRDDNGGDIFVSELRSDNSWSAPKPLPGIINSPYYELSMSVTVDGSALYFASDRPGGQGGLDIYVATKDGRGNWSRVRNLGPVINTERDEDSPFIDYQGKKLYFSSQGHKGMGGHDIFESNLINPAKNEWSEPVNVGSPINTPDNDMYFVSTADGKRAYYASEREDGLGYLDVYSILPKEMAKKNDVVLPVKLVVKVIDAKNNTPLEATIELLSISDSKPVSLAARAKGNYTFSVVTKDPKNYRLSVRHDGYFPQVEEITLQSADMVEKTVTRTVGMAKSEKVPIIVPLKYVVKVVDSKTNAPLEATVKFESTPDNTALTPTPKGNGTFEFAVITPSAKTYRLSVERSGYTSQSQQINLEGAGTVEKTVSKTVALIEAKPVIVPLKYVVKVVDSKTNTPLEATLKLEGLPENDVVVFVSKGSGTYEFGISAAAAKDYKLTVGREGYESQIQTVKLEAASTVEKIVSKTVGLVEIKKEVVIVPLKLTIKVIDVKTNLPVEANLKLEAASEALRSGLTAKTTGTFDFNLNSTLAKEYTITVEKSGYATKFEKFTVEGAGTVSKTLTRTITIEEEKKAPVILPLKLTVKVVDAKTNLPLEANLRLEATGETLKTGITAKSTGVYEFSMTSPQSKEYTITVDKVGYVLKTEKFTVEGAGTVAKTLNQTISIEEVKKELVIVPLKLTIKVVDEKTNLPLDANVKLETPGEPLKSGLTSKATGTFDFSMASPQSKEYTITVEKAGYTLKAEKFTLEGAGTIAKTITRTVALQLIPVEVKAPATAVKLVVSIFDKKTNLPLEANVVLQSAGDNKKIDGTAKGNGVYEFFSTSTTAKDYKLSADKEGYVYLAQQVRIEGATDKEKTINRTLSLQPLAVGATSVLRNLFFDVGKATIKQESYPELTGFENMMKQNPTIRVEISGHTDDIGDNAFNKNLSQQRANAVKAFLVSKGIAATRLVAVGFGETKPLVSNDDEDGGREINRRVELKILSK
jgi:outer membrane protein OmpA-like peptidoglycan-associated protein